MKVEEKPIVEAILAGLELTKKSHRMNLTLAQKREHAQNVARKILATKVEYPEMPLSGRLIAQVMTAGRKEENRAAMHVTIETPGWVVEKKSWGSSVRLHSTYLKPVFIHPRMSKKIRGIGAEPPPPPQEPVAQPLAQPSPQPSQGQRMRYRVETILVLGPEEGQKVAEVIAWNKLYGQVLIQAVDVLQEGEEA